MVRVGVLFDLYFGETLPGESIMVIGQQTELGRWRVEHGSHVSLHLRTSALIYPRWVMLRPIWFDVPAGSEQHFEVEYKYVIDRPRGLPIWEDHIRNRRVKMSVEEGGIFLIIDKRFDSSDERTLVERLNRSEVSARWTALDPEWMVRPDIFQPRRHSLAAAMYVLTPRVDGSPRTREEDEDEDSKYEIVQEFHALSPRHQGLVPRRLRFGSSPSDESVQLTREDPWETIGTLRVENATLREMLRKLVNPAQEPTPPPKRAPRPPPSVLPRLNLMQSLDMVKQKVEEAVYQKRKSMEQVREPECQDFGKDEEDQDEPLEEPQVEPQAGTAY